MTAAQRKCLAIQKSQSFIRTRVIELRSLEEAKLTPEVRTERDTLDRKFAAGEEEYRHALSDVEAEEIKSLSLNGGGADDVELRSLIHDASPGRILAAVHARRNTDGREAELQQHYKVGGNEIPHALLETRAVTAAPAGVATSQAEIIQPIFGQTAAAFLNIPMPGVEPGAAAFPIISSRPSAETPAEGASVTADIPAQTFAATLLRPQAAQAQVEFSREDAAGFPSMSDALGRVIVDAVGFELDRQLLVHTTEGLLAGGLATPGNPGAQATFSDYRKSVNDQVNGREAGTAADCRILLGQATYAHADEKFRTSDSELSALDWMMAKSGGVRVHTDVPAVSSKRQDAVIAKALGQQHAVMPTWSSIQLVTDEVTKLQKRLIVLTAIQLFAFKVLRTDGFARVRFQVTA